jgi:hypothetical protein
MTTMTFRPAYQPFWCEENIWHLAGAPQVGSGKRLVLILTGSNRHVACWSQRATPPDEAVLWDYHVVLAVRSATECVIWDLDTRLGYPVPAAIWLGATIPVSWSSRRRIIAAIFRAIAGICARTTGPGSNPLPHGR